MSNDIEYEGETIQDNLVRTVGKFVVVGGFDASPVVCGSFDEACRVAIRTPCPAYGRVFVAEVKNVYTRISDTIDAASIKAATGGAA